MPEPHDPMPELLASIDQAAKTMPMIAPVLAGVYHGLVKEYVPPDAAAKMAVGYVIEVMRNQADEDEG